MDTYLNLVVIRVANIERSAKFYELLDLSFTKHSHGSGPEHYACELGNLVFEIYPREKDGQPTSATRIGFQVALLDEVMEKLKKSGVKIISPAKDSPWGRRAVVSDPDGHRVELTEQPA
jgi:lactoylglutathione lyase